MAFHEGTETAEVPASPRQCFEAMTDYEALPGWQRALTSCEVISRGDDGLGREVHYEVDARIKTVSYRLEHSYERPHAIHHAERARGVASCLLHRFQVRTGTRRLQHLVADERHGLRGVEREATAQVSPRELRRGEDQQPVLLPLGEAHLRMLGALPRNCKPLAPHSPAG